MPPVSPFPNRWLTTLVVAAALTLPHCQLRRVTIVGTGTSTAALNASVTPTLLCPGDAVTTTWDYHETTRTYCPYDDPACLVTLAVRLEPEALFAAEPVPPGALAGTRTIVPDEEVTIGVVGESAIRVRRGDPPTTTEARTEWARFESALEFVVPDVPRLAVAEGFCAATAPSFRPVALPPHEETTSESVQIRRLCNRSSYDRVVLRVLYLLAPDAEVPLGRGAEACADVPMSPLPRDRVREIHARPDPFVRAGLCLAPGSISGGSPRPPDDITLEAAVNCRPRRVTGG